MGKIVVFLVIVCAGAAAYAKARREGTWSWSHFCKTVFALSALGAAAGILVIRVSAWMGPGNAFLSTMLGLAVIAAGVAGITLWLRGRPGQRPGR